MRAFYLAFQIRQTLSDESESQVAAPTNFTPSLSWSNYCELLKVFASKYKLALPSEKELRQKLGDLRS